MELTNPMDAEAVVEVCEDLKSKVVSITGGEPLVQAEFVGALARESKGKGLEVHLETNGVLYMAMAEVRQWVDVVAMDIKLPSSGGMDACWQDHLQFLVAAKGSRPFVKVVVDRNTAEEEMRRCGELVAGVDPQIPMVIQPRTGGPEAESGQLMRLQEVAAEKLVDVRVIPQCHKVLGLL